MQPSVRQVILLVIFYMLISLTIVVYHGADFGKGEWRHGRGRRREAVWFFGPTQEFEKCKHERRDSARAAMPGRAR